MNLPESLERLEISPDRPECCKQEDSRILTQLRPPNPSNSNEEPEKILETLSINAVCPKGKCSCNIKRDVRDKGLKRLVNKRPIIRRSKLSQAVLRAPVLRLPGSSPAELSSSSPPLAATAEGIRPLAALLPESSSRLHSFLPYYYSIKGKSKDGFTYVLYLNGGHHPWGLCDYLKHYSRVILRGDLCRWLVVGMRSALVWVRPGLRRTAVENTALVSQYSWAAK